MGKRFCIFVRFSWQERPGHRATAIEIAVVQPWEFVPWLDRVDAAEFDEPPWRLTKEKSQLQVMEVRALRHGAGRVPIDGPKMGDIRDLTRAPCT